MNDNEKKFIAIKKANNKSQKTIKTYESTIKKFNKVFNKPVDKITFEEFTNFLDTVKSEYSKVFYMTFLKTFYNLLELPLGDLKYLKPNQPKVNHEEYKTHIITDGEYNTLLNIESNPRNKALFEILKNTGFRAGEIISIKYGGIKITDDKIYISCTQSKKITREIPIFNEMIHTENLIKIFHETKNPDDYLFLTKYRGAYKQMTQLNINDILKKACNRAGIKHHKPHDFRHAKA